MWFPDEKMDVNKFKVVHILPKSHYLSQFGFSSAPTSSYTGEEFAPMPKDKIGSIAEMEAYDAMMQRQELQAEQQKQTDNPNDA